MQKINKAFTLIELLVVIAIIGILSTVVLINLSSTRARARDARRKSDLANMRLALEMFYDANGSQYPAAATTWTDFKGSVDGIALAALMSGNALPIEPSGTAFSYCYAKDATDTNKYEICTYLETTTGHFECLPGDMVANSCSTASLFGR